MVALLPVQDPERAIERADNSGRKRMRIKASEWRRDLKRVQEEGDGGWGMSSRRGSGNEGGSGGGDGVVVGGLDGATCIGGDVGGSGSVSRGMSSGLAVFRRRIERASRLAAFEGTISPQPTLYTPFAITPHLPHLPHLLSVSLPCLVLSCHTFFLSLW